MERIVKHITKRLAEELPEDQETYKLSDLHASGIPRFVVKRIEVELERNLAESIVLPETEWADMESETVRQAWDQFVNAIRAQARLPESYSKAVLETAVSDIMDILVQPRKNLPDVIFGASDELDYHEVVNRVDAIVVYRHFASLIPRYMEKRGINALSKGWCAKVIAQADEKLTARYTPLNWAQMLEPLFLLMEEQIDSNLLRLFFEDKNKPRLARQFDLMNQSLNRSQLIEVLSSPDLPDDDDLQNELFASKAVPPKRSEVTSGWEGLVKQMQGDQEDEPEIQQVDADRSKEDEDLLNQFYEEEADEEPEANEPEKEEGSLNEIFTEEEEEDDTVEAEAQEPEETETEEKSLEEQLQEFAARDERKEPEARAEPEDHAEQNTGEESLESQEEPLAEDTAEPEEEDVGEEEIAGQENEEQQPPMWQKFMSSQELEETEDQEDPEQTALAEEDEEFEDEEEPLIDLTEEEEPDNEQMTRLKNELQNDRERFVEDIFGGADEAYEQALEEIAAKDDWRSASRFIEKDIFKRNLVDMYSEAAVEFTDRLHSYFMEAGKSN